jgi:UDP-3-O-[3-hydroxymyristoyl] glucosamine N-acyltransferase
LAAPRYLRLAEIAAHVGGDVLGDGESLIRQVAPLSTAMPGEISFLANPKYRKQLDNTQASAVIVSPKVAAELSEQALGQFSALVAANPYATYARVAALLNPVAQAVAGIPVSAMVHETASVAASASIGPGVVIGQAVVVGEKAVIGANTVLGDGVTVGANSFIYPNVTLYAGVSLGQRVIVHSGTVIGADGFGFAPSAEGWIKIPQIGGVQIGDDVEIGANTTIDRGALADTVIGNGCKLDNQIQIGHNCVIGEHTVIAGCVGVAGSTQIGSWCAIGGAAMILGHLQIADRCEISPGTMVMKSITQPGKYTALMPLDTHENWLSNASQLRHLHVLAKRVADLEKQLKNQIPSKE